MNDTLRNLQRLAGGGGTGAKPLSEVEMGDFAAAQIPKRPSAFGEAFGRDQQQAFTPPTATPPRSRTAAPTAAAAPRRPAGPMTGDVLFAAIESLRAQMEALTEQVEVAIEETRAFQTNLGPVLESLRAGSSLVERVAKPDGDYSALDDILNQPTLGDPIPEEIIAEAQESP